jgi:hypothetical protein
VLILHNSLAKRTHVTGNTGSNAKVSRCDQEVFSRAFSVCGFASKLVGGVADPEDSLGGILRYASLRYALYMPNLDDDFGELELI